MYNRYNTNPARIMTNAVSHPFIVFVFYDLCHSMAKRMPKSIKYDYLVGLQCVMNTAR